MIKNYIVNGSITKVSGWLSFFLTNKKLALDLSIHGATGDFSNPAGKTFKVSGKLNTSLPFVTKPTFKNQTFVYPAASSNISVSTDNPNLAAVLTATISSDWKLISNILLTGQVKNAAFYSLVKAIMVSATAVWQNDVIEPVPVPDPTPGPTPDPVPGPSGKLVTAFLLPGQKGSKYTNGEGRTSTLCMANDADRTAMDGQRLYVVNYLQSIKANVLPMIVTNDDTSPNSYINPWGNGWGGPIPSAKLEFLAWMYFKNNDRKMFGAMCSDRGISQIPILFCSENKGGPLSSPAWAEQFIKDLKPFFLDNGNVKWVCTHLEAEKFVTPAEVNRIAGFVRKYMPGVGVCVHATVPEFAKCDVDAVAVQAPWHPRDGNSHTPDEVVRDLQRYLDNGAKAVIAGEYNWNSESDMAKAQGQVALKMSKCLGAWTGF